MVQFITAANVATAGLFEIEFVEPIGRNAIAQQVCLYSVAQVLALGSRGIDDTRRDTEIVAVNELIDVAQELMLVRPEVLGDVSRLYAIPICRLDLEDCDKIRIVMEEDIDPSEALLVRDSMLENGRIVPGLRDAKGVADALLKALAVS